VSPAQINVLTFPDYAVILLYLIGTLAIGVFIGTRTKTGTDFFLAGRQLPWWAIGMSLVATDIGGTDIIGWRSPTSNGSAAFPR
jgi:solute:Na+ symporter, SSS family